MDKIKKKFLSLRFCLKELRKQLVKLQSKKGYQLKACHIILTMSKDSK
jgi:hypothetical protein